METKRKYTNGQLVIVTHPNYKMIVIDATLSDKGWKYQLAFPRKDGKPDQRKIHRFFYETDIKAV